MAIWQFVFIRVSSRPSFICVLLRSSAAKTSPLCKSCARYLENESHTLANRVDAARPIADNPERMLFYLAGSIEYSPDLGKGWRTRITPLLKSLGHEVYDPAEDEKKNLTETEAREFRDWKTSDLPRFQETVRKIIAYDLDLIENQCDAIVCFWDRYAGRGAGTQGELTFAHRLGIPVYLICGVPVEEISGWLLGCASEVFADFDGFCEFMSDKPAQATACRNAS
jgi:nucleoside 2-deoxyribosyltransferase